MPQVTTITASPTSSRPDAAMIRSPIFLVAAERSGSTMLRLMLDHHPMITWCSEFEYAVEHVSDSGFWPDIGRTHRFLSTHRIFCAHGFQIDPELNYPNLVNSFLLQHQQRSGLPIAGATVHKHFDRLLRIWPKARFIHLIRDGRDVARSSIGMGWMGNVWCAAENWQRAEQLWQQVVGHIPSTRWMELHYEELIRNPQSQLDRICHFLEVGFDPAMLSYSQDSSYDLPDPKLIGQWRHKLSDGEIRLLEARIGQLLEQRGYALSGLPPMRVGAVGRWWLRLHSRVLRARFRIGRYGLGLYLADFLSRRLGVGPWRRRVQLSLNQIDKAHLK